MDTRKALKTLKESGALGETINVAVEVLSDYEEIKAKRDATERAHQDMSARYLGLKASVDKMKADEASLEARISALRTEKASLEAAVPKIAQKAADARQMARDASEADKAKAAKARQECLDVEKDLEDLRTRVEEEKVRLSRLLAS